MKNYKELFGSLVQGEYPNIKAQNATGPSAQDGTPYTADIIDDIWGFHQALMSKAGLTPNGNSETAGSSQMLDAIRGLSMAYATCSTAAGTAAKTVTVTGFELKTGAQVTVKFTNANTHASAALNVSETGAAPIWYKGAQLSADYIKANGTYLFVYNGTQWDLVGDITEQPVKYNIPDTPEFGSNAQSYYTKTKEGIVTLLMFAGKHGGGTISTGEEVTVLPAGFRPSSWSYIPATYFYANSTNYVGGVADFSTAGIIKTRNVPNGCTQILIALTYMGH